MSCSNSNWFATNNCTLTRNVVLLCASFGQQYSLGDGDHQIINWKSFEQLFRKLCTNFSHTLHIKEKENVANCSNSNIHTLNSFVTFFSSCITKQHALHTAASVRIIY